MPKNVRSFCHSASYMSEFCGFFEISNRNQRCKLLLKFAFSLGLDDPKTAFRYWDASTAHWLYFWIASQNRFEFQLFFIH